MMTAAMLYALAKGATIANAVRGALGGPRVPATAWALGVGAIASLVVVAIGWVTLMIHDVNTERRTTAACVAKTVADAAAAEAAAWKRAVADRDAHIERAAIRQFAVEQTIVTMEAEKRELRDALAKTSGDAAVVFDVADSWLQGRARPAPPTASRGRSGKSPVR